MAGCEKAPVRDLPNEAYVWQSPERAQVRQAVEAASGFVSTFHFRAAELKWSDGHFLIDEVVLPVPGCGLVVRIAASASSLDWTPPRIDEVAEVFRKSAMLGQALRFSAILN